jgi:hypothetical protein
MTLQGILAGTTDTSFLSLQGGKQVDGVCDSVPRTIYGRDREARKRCIIRSLVISRYARVEVLTLILVKLKSLLNDNDG